MSFSFGGPSSTPGFGAPSSSPAFGFGNTASTPTFGSSTSTFSAASTPSFGTVNTPAFGATSTPSFGAPAQTPAPFGAPSSQSTFSFGGTSPSLFGATNKSPSLFGAPTPGGFVGGSAPSLFGTGLPPTTSPPAGMAPAQFLTKDNRPIKHSTKWDELSAQAQQALLQLDKVVSSSRMDCNQLDATERLKKMDVTRAGLEDDVQSLSQSIAAVAVRLKKDMDETEYLGSEVMHLLRHAEIVLHSYNRNKAWRDANVVHGQPVPAHLAEQLGGTIALPSEFLSSTVEELQEKLKFQLCLVSDLQATLLKQRSGQNGGLGAAIDGDPKAIVASLHSAVANIHDCLIRIASKLQNLDEKMAAARTVKLTALQKAGYTRDPFEEAAKQDKGDQASKWQSVEMEQCQDKGMKQDVGIVGGQGFASAVGQFAPPTGLFGTVNPTPISSGTLFGNAPATGLSSRRRGRR